MAKKIFNFLKNLILFFLVNAVILLIIYVVLVYVIKDTAIIENIKSTIQYIIKDKNIYVELKDENFKNEVEKARYYYYLQLDENAKTIYMVLENNIENFKQGKDNIELPTSICNIMQQENGEKIVKRAFQDAWDAFSKDKPELFYFDGNKFCLVIKSIQTIGKTEYELYIGKGQNENYFISSFKSQQEVEQAISDLENKKSQIISTIKKDDNEYTYSYEKILQIHDWLIENVSYDTEMQYTNNTNIYGAISEGNAICEAYAETFKYLMDELEVPCIFVCGEGKDEDTNKQEKHAWNYVYIGGNWYAIDTTWDDPVINTSNNIQIIPNSVKYKYFLKGSGRMQKTHIPTGEVIEGGKVFEYPELNEKDFEI